MSWEEIVPAGMPTLMAAAKITLQRQGRARHTIYVDYVVESTGSEHLKARVSCDDRKTWGWQVFTRQELVEAMD